MKKNSLFCGVNVVAMVIAASCSASYEKLEQRAKEVSTKLESHLVGIREDVHATVQVAEAAFKSSRMVADELAILKNKGVLGLFESPQGSILFGTDKAGVSFYLSPGTVMSPDVERAGRVFLGLGDSVASSFAKHKDYLTVFFVGLQASQAVAIFQPYVNTSALYPPNLDFSQFEWFKRGLESTGSGLWSVEPFTDLSTGWVQDVAESFNTGLSEKGVAIAGINLRLVAAQLEKFDETGKFMLLSPNHTVIIVGHGLKSIIPVPDLGNYDFTAQTNTNHYASDQYKLGGPSQTDEVKKLDSLLSSGVKNFTFELGGRSFKGSQAPIAELKWTLVVVES